MLRCAICDGPLPVTLPCQWAHAEHCHECYSQNLGRGQDAREHRMPQETLVLSPQDVQALVRYRQHVERTRTLESDGHDL
jgi:hypothetical protein